MKKVKILFIHHATGWGGAPKSLIQLIDSLDKVKYSAHVLLLKDSIIAKKLKERNINYTIAKSKFYRSYYTYFTHSEADYVKWYQFLKFFRLSLVWFLSRYIFAHKELESIEADIIHINSSVLTDWPAPSRKLGKVIIHIREPFRKGKFDLLHYFFRSQLKKYTNQIIAISKDNAKRVNIQDKTTVVYNYADRPNELFNQNSYSSKQILYLGGAAKIKGFYTLVKALDYLEPDIKVVFAGYYPLTKNEKNTIKRLLKSLLRYKRDQAVLKVKSHKNALYTGLTHNISAIINSSCCMLSPFSKPHFSRPVIEAYMHHKPAIGSDVDGMAEIISPNETGVLFKKDNPTDLARSINYLANNPNLAMEMGNRAYKIAQKVYSPDNIKEFEQIYSQLFSNNNIEA